MPNSVSWDPAQHYPAAPVGNPVPNVTVSPTGQIDLPYSPAWSQALLDALAQSNNDLTQLTAQEQSENIRYGNDKIAADRQNVVNQRTALNTSAGRGTALSSATGVGLSNVASQYLAQMNQLDSEHTGAINGFDMRRTGIVEDFRRRQQYDAQKYAEELAGKAGTLGYGNGTAPTVKNNPPKPVPTPKPKPKRNGPRFGVTVTRNPLAGSR